MSAEQARTASLLLQEGFGDLVKTVGSYLISHGACQLADIIKGTKLKPNQVKKSLCALIQHQLIVYEPHKGSHMIYRVNSDSVLLRVRFPRCIHAAKVLFGDAGELIVEDIIQQGYTLMSQCIERVSERLEEAGVEQDTIGDIVKQQFVALVEGHFLQRVKPPNKELVSVSPGMEEPVGTSSTAAQERFELPPSTDAIKYTGRKRRRSDSAATEDEPSAKRSRKEKRSSEDKPPVDAGIHWHINFERFHQYFRDQAIISAVGQRVDETAANVMRAVLHLTSSLLEDTPTGASKSAELYTVQIADALPDKPSLSRSELEQYLSVLTDDESQFLLKTGDSGGGSYRINFRHANELLCKAAIESIVRERFGSKCVRVFRLLLTKRMLEQKQVADMAMIPSKEAKEMLYTLLAENFVILQEVPRTPDYAPSRTFYLFSVNLLHVARMVVERCYKALGNLITRRAREMKDNRRLLEKSQVYERQLAELQQGGASGEGEVEEVLTPGERERVDTVKRTITKLERAELQLDETIMIISSYITTHSSSSSSPSTLRATKHRK